MTERHVVEAVRPPRQGRPAGRDGGQVLCPSLQSLEKLSKFYTASLMAGWEGKGDIAGRQPDLSEEGGQLAERATRYNAPACTCLENCSSFTVQASWLAGQTRET